MDDDYKTRIGRLIQTDQARERYNDLVDLMRLLSDCIIKDEYAVSGDLSQAIRLTPAGDAVFQGVARASKPDRRIPPNEARLMCALALGSEELFVDLEKTDIDPIVRAISRDITSGKIRFPFTFGRDAYDAFASQHEDGVAMLTYEETQRFLDALPHGVNQYGRFVTGPFGLQTSLDSREMRSGRQVEAFHCSDVMCGAVHRTHLTTSTNAAINKHRERFHEEFGRDRSRDVDWFQVADDFRDKAAVMFADVAVGVSATLVGDALSLEELRALVVELLDGTQGEMRRQVAHFLEVKSAGDAVANLNRAELLQIVLVAREDAIHQALDHLVDDETILIRAGEIRRPVVNAVRRSGAFGLSPELGHYGLRFVSTDPSVAMLRLRNEILRLHAHAIEGREEVEWQLRNVEGETVEERLDQFFRDSEPADCLRKLVMTRKSLVDVLARRLGIDRGLGASDDDIAQRLLWKLGFTRFESDDPRAEFWRLHDRLIALTKQSRSPASRDTEEYLGVASKYFRELERYLTESLAFAAWALLEDHADGAAHYEFGLESDHVRGLELLQSTLPIAGGDDAHGTFDYLSEKLDLYTLVRGFGFLGRYLEGLDPTEHERDREEYPAYSRSSELKTFPFRHRVPYLDLAESSRLRLRTKFVEISQTLQRDRVTDFRNSHQHYRKTATGIQQIEQALSGIEHSMRAIEDLGLGLIELKVDDELHDRWGRSEYYFVGARGARHVLARPSNFDWLGMPALGVAQYVVTGAVFGEPNEVLRFIRRADSPYSEMWTNYPDRRRSQGSGLRQDTVEHPGAEIRGSHA